MTWPRRTRRLTFTARWPWCLPSRLAAPLARRLLTQRTADVDAQASTRGCAEECAQRRSLDADPSKSYSVFGFLLDLQFFFRSGSLDSYTVILHVASLSTFPCSFALAEKLRRWCSRWTLAIHQSESTGAYGNFSKQSVRRATWKGPVSATS